MGVDVDDPTSRRQGVIVSVIGSLSHRLIPSYGCRMVSIPRAAHKPMPDSYGSNYQPALVRRANRGLSWSESGTDRGLTRIAGRGDIIMRQHFTFALIAALLPMLAAAQTGDSYPNRPVKLLIPYAPGGATDIIARDISPKLQEVLGQPFVVDNRPGASGNIALEAAAKAPPDGYTLEVGNVSTNAINESTFANVLPIKPSRDLVGISKLVEIPHVLVAAMSFPPNSVAEMIEWAKRNPGKLNYASAGLGTYPQLDMLRLLKVAGIEATHIPYKGGAGQMLPALMSGEVQVSFINLASTIEQIRAGRLKALATTMPTRVPELPSVPTMAEQGFPDIGTNAWQGLFAPAATPKPILDKLHAAVVAVLSRPEMKELLAQQMMAVAVSKSPQEFTEQVRAETQAWSEVVRDNKIKIE
ncbi:MAG: tripartite tricarboxylate transporter substrate binding protein [Betaproteobacteria bacterium]|nr:MAG: tripartite tricarboxylate transporter substrate binding protein [Betaproteobacteria bacterium]